MTTLHIVPHTHWDREWYLPFQSMRIKLVHLVDFLLRVLAEDPEYRHFTLDGQTIVAEDYLEIRPERRGEIVGHVSTGRLLVGPWTVLPDEFLVSPEALVRNLKRGARVARDLGGCMQVGYVPDPFGHIGQLPQILRGFGIESAAFRRGLSDEPCELYWEGPDGSRVLVAYLREGYDNAARLPTDPEAFAAVVRRRGDRLAPHSAVSHLLLLNGTDHHEPQPELPSLLSRARTDGNRWLLSTLPAYMESVREETESRGVSLPVVKGELRSPKRHHVLAGVLSSRVWIKQRNDACERLLERWAEPFLAWAQRFCAEQPDRSVWTGQLETPRVRGAEALLAEAWRILLTCHPHDSICGCSVDQVHEEMRSRFDQVEQIAEEVTRQSLSAIACAIDTSPLAEWGARSALVIFNPAAARADGLAGCTLELGAGLEPFEVVDGEGSVLPTRIVRSEARELGRVEFAPPEIRALIRGIGDGRVMGLAVESVEVSREGSEAWVELVVSEGGEPNLDAVRAGVRSLEEVLEDPALSKVRLHARFATRVEFEVWVPEVPGHGVRALGIRRAQSELPAAKVDDEARISNRWLEVQANPDGTVSLTDLQTGRTLSGLLRLRDEGDRGDSYTFCSVEQDAPVEKPTGRVDVHREIASCMQSLKLELKLRVPRKLAPERTRRTEESVELSVRIRITLARDVARADVSVEVDNTAEDHRLQLLFPLGAPVAEAFYDGHYEIVRRPTEVPDGGADWQEQPTAEQPMRTFVAADPSKDGESLGLLVAAHGLREASVSPEGTIAVTLLRCFGWLSRDDLSTRAGGAGPQIPTPGGQCPGTHTFRLSLIPFTGDVRTVLSEADAFQTGMRGVGTALHPGTLPGAVSLLQVSPSTFRVSAVHPGNDPDTVVVRGVYLEEGPGEVRMRPFARPDEAWEVRLDEEQVAPIEPAPDGTLRIPARPNQIVSVRMRYGRA